MNNDFLLSPINKSELIQQIGDYVLSKIQDIIINQKSEPEDVLLSQKQAAELLNCSVQWLLILKKQQKIPFRKINSRVYYSKNAILSLIQGKK